MKILVTGGAGYIGSHACKALSEAGFTPVTFDSLERGHRAAVKWGPLEIGDLCERGRLDAVMAEHRPAAIMHFAAYADVGESVAAPLRYYRNNVTGSLNLIEAARTAGLLPIVFSSTCAVYGAPQTRLMDETHPRLPVNPYGASKMMVERMLSDCRAAHGLQSVALRYFNAAGAAPEAGVGESHDPETHLIPLVLQVAAGRRDALTVFGDDYETPDGTCIRDYIHVRDIADAHVLALRRLLEDPGGRDGHDALNLGTGTGHSVLEIIDAARKVTGRRIPVKTGPRRAGDPARLVADPGLARRVLGWRPARADIATQIGDAWAWEQERTRKTSPP